MIISPHHLEKRPKKKIGKGYKKERPLGGRGNPGKEIGGGGPFHPRIEGQNIGGPTQRRGGPNPNWEGKDFKNRGDLGN